MVKLLRYCALVVGALLIGVAVVLAMRVKSTLTTTTASSMGRAEVVLAVSELQGGCFTCHTVLNELPTSPHTPQVVLTSRLERPSYAVRQPRENLPVALSNAQVNTELIKLGQRILDLPTSSDPRVKQASAEFERIYEQAQTTTSQAAVPGILQRISAMDDLLRTLENQALPYTVQEDDQPSSPVQSVAANHFPPNSVGPVVSLSVASTLEDIDNAEAPLFDQTPHLRTQDMIFAVRRHGPPSVVGVFSDSVCNGRLPSVDAQSPFILLLLAAGCVPQHTLSQI